LAEPVAPDDFRPLAIVATYNDRDIIRQTTSELLDDGFDVHAIDNWSEDGSYEVLEEIARSRPALSLERFPAEGPSRYYEWGAILDRKDQVAQLHPGRWIVHHDSDEIRESPWTDVSFRPGLYAAERAAFNAVDFTVRDFRPVDENFAGGVDPEAAFRFFEFGSRPGHFLQVKAWRQPEGAVNLRASGGHEARFEGRRIFPYKFLLKHYPLRSAAQARRKIFTERFGRFSPEERAAGWLIQYDQWRLEDRFVWDRDSLIAFDERGTRRTYLVELLSGIGIAR
jgi:hypothetical protein